MKIVFLVLTLIFASVCNASTSGLVIAIARSSNPTAVAIELPADYVVVPLSISSDLKDPLQNLEAIRAAKAALTEAEKSATGVSIRYGVQSFVVSNREDGFLSSFSSGAYNSQSDTYVANRLTKQKNAAQAAKEIITFLRGITKPESIHFRFGNTSLGLDDPARYRTRLLSLISKEVESTRNAVGKTKTYELSGLESQVQVMQQDEQNVLVFIPYRLKIGQ